MTDDDIHAFPSGHAQSPTPSARPSRRSLWPWVLLALLAGALGVGVAVLSLLAMAVVALAPLWLAGLVLWLILRRRPAAAATMRR